jgi:hypothetical protein
MGMILGFFLLLLFQLVGEVLARGLSLPAPGPKEKNSTSVLPIFSNRIYRNNKYNCLEIKVGKII